MKKIFLGILLFWATGIITVFGQGNEKNRPAQLLSLYYTIKDALVSGNAGMASIKAGELVKLINEVDTKIVNEASRDALLKDASPIAETKDIKYQRGHFSTLSTNMYILAKTTKLTAQPVYYAYCPMKKAYWLSSEATIKNPYFGSSMLTCGKVEATLQ